MSKFAENTTTKTTSDDEGNFLERKSTLHYTDYDVNKTMYGILEIELNKYYKDNKDINIEFSQFKYDKPLELIITINFNKNDAYYQLTNNFLRLSILDYHLQLNLPALNS